MNKEKEDIEKEIGEWEVFLQEFKQCLEKQQGSVKLEMSHDFFKVQNDLQSLKYSINTFWGFENDPNGFQQHVLYHAYLKVRKEIRHLKELYDKNTKDPKSNFFDKISDKFQETKNELSSLVSNVKKAVTEDQGKNTSRIGDGFSKVGKAIDEIDSFAKEKMDGVGSDVKKLSSKSIKSLKKQSKELKKWYEDTKKEFMNS
ncbi:MAG: hypothetical protein NE328_02725 [Lentisphaeraceae bacterium]|nr:hypothetical protein [Lentisphaeraceae bacterium]